MMLKLCGVLLDESLLNYCFVKQSKKIHEPLVHYIQMSCFNGHKMVTKLFTSGVATSA
jgi:hypothetical protein